MRTSASIEKAAGFGSAPASRRLSLTIISSHTLARNSPTLLYGYTHTHTFTLRPGNCYSFQCYPSLFLFTASRPAVIYRKVAAKTFYCYVYTKQTTSAAEFYLKTCRQIVESQFSPRAFLNGHNVDGSFINANYLEPKIATIILYALLRVCCEKLKPH